MAVPSDLTANIIVQEAFHKVGTASPSTTLQGRAEAYFLREVLNDIYTRQFEDGNTRLKTLQDLDVQITTIGISKYSLPSDFDEEITVTFLDGSHTGTATAGAATTITLAADEDAAVADVEGKWILLTGGTGKNGLRQCTDYNTTTMIATVNTAWDTNPAAATTYRIIDKTTEIEEDNLMDVGALGSTSFIKGKPSSYCKIREAGTQYIILNKPADVSTYGILIRFYTNPNRIDLAATIMTTVYNDWQNPLTLGVARRIALDEDDGKYEWLNREYEHAVKMLFYKEIPYGGEFKGFVL